MDNVIRLETAAKIAFNNNRVTTAVFLDLSKAYDITWTNGLLYKLTTMDVKGPILKWLYNFLTERKIQVRVGNSLSDEMTMDKGVPQGSVLSPLLFNVMMSDFPQPEDDCDLSLFADDIELHTSTETKKEAEPIIQDYLDRIEEWTYAWRLNFSVDKCAYVTFSRRRTQEPPINITLDGTNIKEVDQPCCNLYDFVNFLCFTESLVNKSRNEYQKQLAENTVGSYLLSGSNFPHLTASLEEVDFDDFINFQNDQIVSGNTFSCCNLYDLVNFLCFTESVVNESRNESQKQLAESIVGSSSNGNECDLELQRLLHSWFSVLTVPCVVPLDPTIPIPGMLPQIRQFLCKIINFLRHD